MLGISSEKIPQHTFSSHPHHALEVLRQCIQIVFQIHRLPNDVFLIMKVREKYQNLMNHLQMTIKKLLLQQLSYFSGALKSITLPHLSLNIISHHLSCLDLIPASVTFVAFQNEHMIFFYNKHDF